MFCFKCGTNMDDSGVFCPNCGAQQPSEDGNASGSWNADSPPSYGGASAYGDAPVYGNAPAYGNTPAYGGPPPVKAPGFFARSWKILVPAIVVVAAAVAAIVIITGGGSSSTLGKAFSNLEKDSSARLNNSPLGAIGLLADCLENGSLSVDFEYSDYWGDETSGTVTLNADSGKRNYSALIDLSMNGQNLDLEAFINKERLAVRSSLLDGECYGFKYSTFREDITKFGSKVGLDRSSMNTAADYIDILNEMMNAKSFDDKSLQQYSDAFSKFMQGLKPKSEKADFKSGGGKVSCTAIEYTITDTALIDLLNEYYALLEKDAALREQFDMYGDLSPMLSGVSYGYGDMMDGMTSGYDSFLDSIEKLIAEIEDSFSGDIVLTFYIATGDRLVGMTAFFDIEAYGEPGTIDMTLDFGAEPEDPWVITVKAKGDRNSDSSTVEITWDYKETSGDCVNTITFLSDDGYYENMVTFSSKWSPKTGKFTLSFDYGYSDSKITGVYLPDDNGFKLSFDAIVNDYSGESLSLTFTAKKGAKIDDPRYINLDKWDESLIEQIGSAFSMGMY